MKSIQTIKSTFQLLVLITAVISLGQDPKQEKIKLSPEQGVADNKCNIPPVMEYPLEDNFQTKNNLHDQFPSLIEKSITKITHFLTFIDESLTNLLSVVPRVKATPIGMLAYFGGECPTGWKEYVHATGRVIIAAGVYQDKAEDGRQEKITYQVGDKGGEVNHKLTIEEIPKHAHRTAIRGIYSGDSDLEAIHNNLRSFYYYNTYYDSQLLTSYEGKDQPHNNMPPYLVLRLCEKIQEQPEYVTLEKFTSLENDFNELKTKIESLYATKTELNDYLTKEEADSKYAKVSYVNEIEDKIEEPIKESLNDLKLDLALQNQLLQQMKEDDQKVVEQFDLKLNQSNTLIKEEIEQNYLTQQDFRNLLIQVDIFQNELDGQQESLDTLKPNLKIYAILGFSLGSISIALEIGLAASIVSYLKVKF